MTLIKHISVLALIFSLCSLNKLVAQPSQNELSEWEVWPIVNYDTDVGFGYGAKCYLFNLLSTKESFDIIIYNSTKGERWYRFEYSIPDKQYRQGKKFDFAFDISIDYDKWINYPHFYNSRSSFNIENIPPTSKEFESETYTREPLEIELLMSKALTSEIILEGGLKYSSVGMFGFDSQGSLKNIQQKGVKQISAIFNIRIDTRSSYLNPKSGFFIQGSNQYAKGIFENSTTFYQVGLDLQSFFNLFESELIFASRILLESQTNSDYQNALALGGNNTVRGLQQARYLSKSFILLNEEIRFPIYKRLGGILGADICNSKSTPGWITNVVVGLRFYMDNFIVRGDVGFSDDYVGVYLNFGHLF